MGTSCYIGAKYDKEVVGSDEIVGSYCHYDGYLSGVGMTLLENWNGDQAYALASHGYFSGIVESLKELGSPKDQHANSDSAEYFKTEGDFLERAVKNNGCEFAYLYIDGQWNYFVLDSNVIAKDHGILEGSVFLPELRHSVRYFTEARENYDVDSQPYKDYSEYIEFYSKKVDEYTPKEAS